MDVSQRKAHVQSASLCSNCLRPGHLQQSCSSTYRCRICKQTHNTLLHNDAVVATASVNSVVANSDSNTVINQPKQKLMMTSQVLLTSSSGKQLEARAMLDTGAAVSVLSSRMMKLLQIKRSEEWMTVSGVESPKHSPARPTAQVTVTSKINPAWSTSVKVVVLPKAARNLPEHPLPAIKDIPHLKGLGLADPGFSVPRRVDMILDVGFFDEVLLSEKKQGPPGTPSAWKTELGWGVMGHYVVPSVFSAAASVNMLAVAPVEEQHLDKTLEKFWFMEELPRGTPIFSAEDLAIQQHYAATHYFSNSAGRYVITLPKKETSLQLGESHRTALNRFIRNEQSLIKKGNWTQRSTWHWVMLKKSHLMNSVPLCLSPTTCQCMLFINSHPAVQRSGWYLMVAALHPLGPL